jgi:hypothetical protein
LLDVNGLDIPIAHVTYLCLVVFHKETLVLPKETLNIRLWPAIKLHCSAQHEYGDDAFPLSRSKESRVVGDLEDDIAVAHFVGNLDFSHR